MEKDVQNTPETPAPDAVLNVYGETCATLTPLIKARIKELESGQILEVISDDLVAREGVPAWSRLTGNKLLGTVEEKGHITRFYLCKK